MMLHAEKTLSHTDTSEYTSLDSNFISLHEIPENHEIDKRLLNIESKTRSNILTWKGQFSPQLVEILLENYSRKNFMVFDPFLGSGTIIVESVRKNIAVYGTEINPAAYHLSNIYQFCAYTKERREVLLEKFEDKFSLKYNTSDVLFRQNSAKKTIIETALECRNLENDKDYLILIQGLIILLDSFKNGTDDDHIIGCWGNLKTLITSLPYTTENIHIFNEDARKVNIQDNKIDLVITSPPYINVFNYHQQYRASAELLGEKVLEAARSEIGSNRKHRGNRFLTVIQYIYDMHSTFTELKRICKNNARIIFVVGRESNVRKTSFFNSEIIASVAKIAGFEIIFRQERVFTNRFGQKIYEDLIHFSNGNLFIINSKKRLEKLALDVLINSIERAPKEAKHDLQEAIMSVSRVRESPIYKGKSCE